MLTQVPQNTFVSLSVRLLLSYNIGLLNNCVCVFTWLYPYPSAASVKRPPFPPVPSSCPCLTGHSVCSVAQSSAVCRAQSIKEKSRTSEVNLLIKHGVTLYMHLCSISTMAFSISSIFFSSCSALACFFSASRSESWGSSCVSLCALEGVSNSYVVHVPALCGTSAGWASWLGLTGAATLPACPASRACPSQAASWPPPSLASGPPGAPTRAPAPGAQRNQMWVNPLLLYVSRPAWKVKIKKQQYCVLLLCALANWKCLITYSASTTSPHQETKQELTESVRPQSTYIVYIIAILLVLLGRVRWMIFFSIDQIMFRKTDECYSAKS